MPSRGSQEGSISLGSSGKIKKKVVPGSIEIHPTESALVVHYFAQEIVLDDEGKRKGSGEKHQLDKVIKVKSLNSSTNLDEIAKNIAEKCKLIHPSKIPEVVQLLDELRQRTSTESGEAEKALLREHVEEERQRLTQPEIPTMGDASMDELDKYVELLYEEIDDKIMGTRAIMQLARIPENLKYLSENTFCLSALSRVLREDGRRSMDLVFHILFIFYSFSLYPDFHNIITAEKMGDMTLKILDQEVKRFEIWKQDLEKLREKVVSKKQESSGQFENEARKMQAMLRKQDNILFVAFYLLLNLAEDITIEIKMVKRNIIGYLVTFLSRETPELSIVIVTFLKKLSIFKENKSHIASMIDEVLPQLASFIDPSMNHSPLLVNLTFRLLFNLSHDPVIRDAILRHDLVNKVVPYLQDRNQILVVMGLMYQLSLDDKSRSMFLFTDAIPIIMSMILQYDMDTIGPEMVAVGINLATNKNIAEVICQENGLKILMKRALKTKNSLLFKMIKNLSAHEGPIKLLLLDFVDDLCTLVMKSPPTDILIEVIGILGNMNIPEFDFAKLVTKFNFMSFFTRILNAAIASAPMANGAGGEESGIIGTEEDDLYLETIIFIGTTAMDENMGPMVASSNLIPLLLEVMAAREDDDEIVLQILYAIYNFLLLPSTRALLLEKTVVVSYLIDLLYDRNVEVRKLCDVCLDIIADISEEWATKIRQQRFHWHNAEWLELVHQMEEEARQSPQTGGEDSAISPSVKPFTALEQQEMTPLGESPPKVMVSKEALMNAVDYASDEGEDENKGGLIEQQMYENFITSGLGVPAQP